MRFIGLMCFYISTVAILDVFADSFHDREVLDVDDFNTDKERITQLEEQVAVLQEIIGTRIN